MAKKPKSAITPTREEDYPEWYQQVIKAADLYADAQFGAPTATIDAKAVFALDPAMREYLRTDIARELALKGPRQGLYCCKCFHVDRARSR